MRMKASDVGEWLRQRAGKRDHREVVSDDDRVLRPGPNFDWFMTGAAQPTPTAPEPDTRPTATGTKTTPAGNFHRSIGAAAVGSLGCALTRLGQDEREQPRALLAASTARLARELSVCLSAHHKVGEPDDHPDCFEEGGPDHEARHKLHGKPERPQNEVAKLKWFGS